MNNRKNSLTNGQSKNGSKNGKDGKSGNSDKDVNTFEGVPHREWTYVGNAAQNVTIDSISKYIIQKGIPDNDDLIIQLNSSPERLNPSKLASWRNSLTYNAPNFWPDNIITREFDNRKGRYMKNPNSGGTNFRSNYGNFNLNGRSNQFFLNLPYRYTTRT